MFVHGHWLNRVICAESTAFNRSYPRQLWVKRQMSMQRKSFFGYMFRLSVILVMQMRKSLVVYTTRPSHWIEGTLPSDSFIFKIIYLPSDSFIFKIPTRIFYRGVPGFETYCPCGVWCRGLTTCLRLYFHILLYFHLISLHLSWYNDTFLDDKKVLSRQ